MFFCLRKYIFNIFEIFYLMPGIDLLISRDLSIEIKVQLDKNILEKLEKELFF